MVGSRRQEYYQRKYRNSIEGTNPSRSTKSEVKSNEMIMRFRYLEIMFVLLLFGSLTNYLGSSSYKI